MLVFRDFWERQVLKVLEDLSGCFEIIAFNIVITMTYWLCKEIENVWGNLNIKYNNVYIINIKYFKICY